MKTIQSAAKDALKENFENVGGVSFREYVECESQSDPNFFRWLFGEEFDNDFDSDLTEGHRNIFNEFLNTL